MNFLVGELFSDRETEIARGDPATITRSASTNIHECSPITRKIPEVNVCPYSLEYIIS
jgi:hypothetical protein